MKFEKFNSEEFNLLVSILKSNTIPYIIESFIYSKIKIYKNNIIKEEYTIRFDKKHGKYIGYWDNGTKCMEYNFIDGKKHGLCYQYHQNEMLHKKCFFKNNMIEGFYKEWDQNGKLIKECFYVNNLCQGLCKDWTNGYSECYYIDDFIEGKDYIWYENGQLRSITNYKKSKIFGPFINFHENGMICSMGSYNEKGRHGLIKSFHDNGKLRFQVTFHNDKIGNDYIEFDEMGRPSDWVYRYGIDHG